MVTDDFTRSPAVAATMDWSDIHVVDVEQWMRVTIVDEVEDDAMRRRDGTCGAALMPAERDEAQRAEGEGGR